ncbi:hypothetical protein A6S26_02880 [Nostoc sp. ATCC 43529]|nr:hypothetical protein A6S26_02880 [Nostoc sp. ATCC 43529]
MIDIIGFFLLVLIIPFVIAQIMPNTKCLIAYTLVFGTLAIWLYYEHITTPTYKHGNGFSYLFGITAASLFDTSIIVGIINKAIVLYFKSEGYTINIWLIVSLVLLDVMLIVLIFPALLELY